MPSSRAIAVAAAAAVVIYEFGRACQIPHGYTLLREFTGTEQRARFRFAGKAVVLVASPELHDKPGHFKFGAFGFKPVFKRGFDGWYVGNLEYPDGKMPHISNVSPDGAWRITNDPSTPSEPASYPTKAEAAQAVVELVNKLMRDIQVKAAAAATANDPEVADAEENGPKGLSLYLVTLPWGSEDSDTGDYSAKVWAKNEANAVLSLAEEMAQENSELKSDAERAAFVAETVSHAGHYTAEEVAPAVVDGVLELLKGPTGKLSDAAKADFETITATLKKYTAV